MLRALADRLEVARPAYLSPDETEHQHYCNKTLQRLQIESLNKENSLVYIKLKKDHVRKREDRMPGRPSKKFWSFFRVCTSKKATPSGSPYAARLGSSVRNAMEIK